VAGHDEENPGRLGLTSVARGALPGAALLVCALTALTSLATAAQAPIGSGGHPPANGFQWNLPPGFPSPLVPPDNPMSEQKVELGRRLFREPHLSLSGSYACISCHKPELAYTDGRARALGATNVETRRSAMTLTNVAYNPAFTWGDPTVTSLETQMLQPLFNEHPIEMGLKGREDAVVQWLWSDQSYRQLFHVAFPDEANPVSISNLVKAIAAYERTLISGRSPFDRYVFSDDRGALSDSAKRGMALFYSARVGCAQCHFGLNFSGPMRYQGHAKALALFANTGLYSIDSRGAYPKGDRGLIEVTRKPSDMGRMRVPTLRNIALTAPYMHDGSVATLSDAIDHYAKGGRQLPDGPKPRNHLVDRRIHAFQLSTTEKGDLIAFLESLTDPQFIAGHR
jgi:cytochrome c peroxidase